MKEFFPVIIESPDDVLAGLDKLLAWVEQNGCERLDATISRLSQIRAALFGAKSAQPDPLPLREVVGSNPRTGLHASALERRTQIARYIQAHGPQRPKYLAAALNIPVGTIGGLLQHEWFAKANHFDPYSLSDRGVEYIRTQESAPPDPEQTASA